MMENLTTQSPDWQMKQAANLLRDGKLVAFPTETVYGLGADANNPAAIAKVFVAKNRPSNHPLIVHIAALKQLSDWATDIPPAAMTLAKNFWPGPLTMILTKKAGVADIITAKQNTIAIRLPNHPLTLAMLQQFGGAIVGPSANIHGHISPTCAEHVQADLGNKVDLILNGDDCNIGIESTIVSFVNNIPAILRQGSITAEDITNALHTKVSTNTHGQPTSSGMLKSHYAPNQPLLLVKANKLFSTATHLLQQNKTFAIMSTSPQPLQYQTQYPNCMWQQMPITSQQYAQSLYAVLHNLEQTLVDCILVEQPPSNNQWAAIIDRLQRASVKMPSYQATKQAEEANFSSNC